MKVFLRMEEDRLAAMGPWFVVISAINESDHQVRIKRATLIQEGRPFFYVLLENDLQAVAPRDAWDRPVDVKGLRIMMKMRDEKPADWAGGPVGLDLTKPVVAEVLITTGERFRSAKILLTDLEVPDAPDWLGRPWD